VLCNVVLLLHSTEWQQHCSRSWICIVRVDVTEVVFAIGIMILLLFHYNYQVGSEDTDITVYF
jgi:hypothetical protein